MALFSMFNSLLSGKTTSTRRRRHSRRHIKTKHRRPFKTRRHKKYQRGG